MDQTLITWADRWYRIAWVGLLIAGAVTAVGACATIAFLLLQWRTTHIRDGYSELRTSALEFQTAEAHKITAEANKRIAELNGEIANANARQAEAELKLEQLRQRVGPRQINQEAFLKVLEGKAMAPVEIMYPREDGEAFNLSIQIRDLLRAAQWQASEPLPVPPNVVARLANQPSHMAVGGQPTGVSVVVRADTQEEFRALQDREANTPINAIVKALLSTLGSISSYAGGSDIFTAPPNGIVRIVVGPKP